jgi:phosphopantothenoylcysteine synthetase/decarboxylase
MIGPVSGRLSCGETGVGRMVEPEQIVAEIIRLTANSTSHSSPLSKTIL